MKPEQIDKILKGLKGQRIDPELLPWFILARELRNTHKYMQEIGTQKDELLKKLSNMDEDLKELEKREWNLGKAMHKIYPKDLEVNINE